MWFTSVPVERGRDGGTVFGLSSKAERGLGARLRLVSIVQARGVDGAARDAAQSSAAVAE